jgi:hypothetical protein
MHDIRFIDEALDIHKTNSYHLSIQAGLESFSYVLLDPVRYKYIALKHFSFTEEIPVDKYPDHLRELILKDEFLSKEYESIYCIWENPRTTLLPSPLFEKENHLKSPDAYLIFPIHHEIANVFIRHYPRLKFFNQATPFIEFSQKLRDNGSESAHVNIHRNFFDIVIIRNRNLILHNTFKFRNEQDLIYFIMNVYDKISLDPGTCPVYLSGMVEKKSAMTGIIKKFIRNVNFPTPDSSFQYSHTFDRIPEHFFTSLYNLYHCV